MKNWQRIRQARNDITDYVIHFTKSRYDGQKFWSAGQVFGEIIDDGFIRPTFAPIKSIKTGTISNTVRGPVPAVCLTEQPLSAVLNTRRCEPSRYSGFGVAYHKYALFHSGGRPVLYGTKDMLGEKLRPGDSGYQEGKDIYAKGLPAELQYLWVRYKPAVGDRGDYPIDFTWEREWRYKCTGTGLPLFLDLFRNIHETIPMGALVVEQDEHVDGLREYLAAKAGQNIGWAAKLTKIISLETVERMLAAGDERYARIETYPD